MSLDKVDIHDWQEPHRERARSQGWSIVEMGVPGSPYYLEIRAVENGPMGTMTDEDAARALRRALKDREDHAILAYAIIRNSSPSEFSYWGMSTWHANIG